MPGTDALRVMRNSQEFNAIGAGSLNDRMNKKASASPPANRLNNLDKKLGGNPVQDGAPNGN